MDLKAKVYCAACYQQHQEISSQTVYRLITVGAKKMWQLTNEHPDHDEAKRTTLPDWFIDGAIEQVLEMIRKLEASTPLERIALVPASARQDDTKKKEKNPVERLESLDSLLLSKIGSLDTRIEESEMQEASLFWDVEIGLSKEEMDKRTKEILRLSRERRAIVKEVKEIKEEDYSDSLRVLLHLYESAYSYPLGLLRFDEIAVLDTKIKSQIDRRRQFFQSQQRIYAEWEDLETLNPVRLVLVGANQLQIWTAFGIKAVVDIPVKPSREGMSKLNISLVAL